MITSQTRLDLIGSLVPYVTYNLCPACAAEGRGGRVSDVPGQGLPWERPLDALRCSLPSSHILRQTYPGFLYVILLLYFLCAAVLSSLCFLALSPHSHRCLHAVAFRSLQAHWHIHLYAWTPTHRASWHQTRYCAHISQKAFLYNDPVKFLISIYI